MLFGHQNAFVHFLKQHHIKGKIFMKSGFINNVALDCWAGQEFYILN